MKIPTPEEFLGLLDKREKAQRPYAYGTIPGTYTTGLPTILFEGESAPSGKVYPYLSPYVPVAGHRVMLARDGNSWVILGRIINS